MKEDWLLSAQRALDQVSKKLGQSMLNDAQLQDKNSLMSAADGHVYVWNSRECWVESVQMTSSHFMSFTLVPENTPAHTVTGVEVSSGGKWIALYGKDGVTAMEVPKRFGRNLEKLDPENREILCRTITIVRPDRGTHVQKVAWHPGTLIGNYLVVLTTDGQLRSFFVRDNTAREVNSVQLGGSKMATALGETIVDFCFGPSVEKDEEKSVWPMYVLYGDGDVFCVMAELRGAWSVTGPLEVLPEDELNYKEEACSLCVLGNGPGPVVLAIAGVSGAITHSIVLSDPRSARLSLHVYERLELELGAFSSVDSGVEDVFRCPVTVKVDPTSSSTYLASHSSGLHKIDVPFVNDLQNFESKELAPTEWSNSSVEHLLCTRFTNQSRPSPVIGLTVTYPPAAVICLLPDNHFHCIKTGSSHFSDNIRLLSTGVSTGDSSSHQLAAAGAKESLVDRVAHILSRDATQPLLLSVGSGAQSSPALPEYLQLVARTTATLRNEYIAKIKSAKQEMENESKILVARKKLQEDRLEKLEQARASLRDNAERISEKYEDVKDKGTELFSRIEAVLARIQNEVPVSSDAELKMAREVKSLQNRMKQIQGAIDQIKVKEKYISYQVASGGRQRVVGRVKLTQSQVDNVKEVLGKDSQIIAEMVDILNNAEKDLAS